MSLCSGCFSRLLFFSYSNLICHSGPEHFLSGFVPAWPAPIFRLGVAGISLAWLLGWIVCVCVHSSTLSNYYVYQLTIVTWQTTPKREWLKMTIYSSLYNVGWDQLDGYLTGWLKVAPAAVVICRLNCDGRIQEGFMCLMPQLRRWEQLAPLSMWFSFTRACTGLPLQQVVLGFLTAKF